MFTVVLKKVEWGWNFFVYISGLCMYDGWSLSCNEEK